MTIRVVLAEDSPLFAESVTAILEASGDISVVGVAADGEAAVRMTASLRPDVVLMDVRMPVLSGLDAVQAIMARCPTPILVTTADPEGRTGTLAFEALERGALDLVPKPMTFRGTELEQDDLRARIRLLSRIPVVAHLRRGASKSSSDASDIAPPPLSEIARPVEKPIPEPPNDTHPERRVRLVAIGASTGGPAALATILGAMPADYPAPIVVVQHLARGFETQLTAWLSSVTRLRVAIASPGVVLRPGTVHFAPSATHLVVDAELRIGFDGSPARQGHKPSVDVLFESVARNVGVSSAAVLLTGMGGDGAAGLLRIRESGGFTVAQDRETSAVYGMPKVAAEKGAAIEIAPLGRIAAILGRVAPDSKAVRR